MAGVLGLLDTIINTGRGIFERVIPDKAQATAAAHEFEIAIRQQGMREDGAWRQFVISHTGNLTDIPKPVQYLRSLVRPVLTFVITGAYIWGWLHPEAFTPEQMVVLKPAMLLVLAFWFGEKALSRTGLVDVLANKKGAANNGGAG